MQLSIRSRKILAVAMIAVVATLVGMLAARIVFIHPQTMPQLSAGTVLNPSRSLPPFSLSDQDGKVFDNARMKDHWSLVYFGFSNCPEICPTTLTMLKEVSNLLQSLPDKQRPRIVFISVDAKRDTPQVMKAYMQSFDVRFIGVTGEQSLLDQLTTSLGVPSKIIPMNGSDDYMVDHSTAILVIDPQGNWQALFSAPHDAKKLASDYRVLAAH